MITHTPTPYKLSFRLEGHPESSVVISENLESLCLLTFALNEARAEWVITTPNPDPTYLQTGGPAWVVHRDCDFHALDVDRKRFTILQKDLTAYQSAVRNHEDWKAAGRPGADRVDYYSGDLHEAEQDVEYAESRLAFAAAEYFGYLGENQSPEVNPETGEIRPPFKFGSKA